VSYATGSGRQYVINFRAGSLSGISLYLAAVYDFARAGGTGAFTAVIITGVGRSRCAPSTNLPLCRVAAGDPGDCRRFYFYLLTYAGGFYCPATGRSPGIFYRQY